MQSEKLVIGQPVMHIDSGRFYEVVGLSHHRVGAGDWRFSVIYKDHAGYLYSRFADDFDRSFIEAADAKEEAKEAAKFLELTANEPQPEQGQRLSDEQVQELAQCNWKAVRLLSPGKWAVDRVFPGESYSFKNVFLRGLNEVDARLIAAAPLLARDLITEREAHTTTRAQLAQRDQVLAEAEARVGRAAMLAARWQTNEGKSRTIFRAFGDALSAELAKAQEVQE